MAVTNLSAKLSVSKLASKLAADYPDFTFESGERCVWSPEQQKVTYTLNEQGNEQAALWSLLHETAHAVLQHQTYASDFQLLKMEMAAWQKAQEIGSLYEIVINEAHINQCLESYRDWLHQRSKCPTCDVHALQKDQTSYQCLNCKTVWEVADSRLTRPYRKTTKTPA